MANYNLITTLTMSAAGYDKGINQAKQKTQDFQKSAQGAGKKITSALTFVGIGASFAGVMALMKTGLESTGDGADTLVKRIGQVKSGVEALGRSIVQADFANLAQNIKNAMKAAGEFADETDILDTMTSDLSIRKSTLQTEIKALELAREKGELNKDEIEGVKAKNATLVELDLQIAQARVQVLTKYMVTAKQGSMDLNADIFNDLQAGILKRSELSERADQTEYRRLNQVTTKYKEFYDGIVQKYQEVVESQSMGGGLMGGTAVATLAPNWDKVSASVSDYISKLSEVERATLFENQFTDPENWNNLVSHINDANNMLGMFYENQKKILAAGKGGAQGEGSADEAIVRAIAPTLAGTGHLSIPTLASSTSGALATPSQILQTSEWESQAEIIGNVIDSLAYSFQSLGDAIQIAAEDGQISFGEAMTIIGQGALSVIPILSALAAAQMITSQSSKGLIGIVTAIAGVTMILGLFSKYASPKKMAKGGLLYQPTTILAGEYAGARNNPEVIAPLSKLQSLLGLETSNGGDVVFKIQGDTLVGVLDNHTRRVRSYA